LLDDGSENFMCECSPKNEGTELMCLGKCQHSWPTEKEIENLEDI